MTAQRHRFESPQSTQTLAEGLAEYYAVNPQLKREASLLSPEARRFFRAHDIVHVLYGCGTSMPDEAIVKLASLFGTTGGTQVLRGYTHHETLDIYRNLPVAGTVIALLAAPYLIARTVWRCARQRQRWPWFENEQFMNVSLAEIRSGFGIRVAHRTTGSSRIMSVIARGSFTVEMKPQSEPGAVEGVNLGRMSLDKRFEGDLVATGQGEMLTALTPVKGSAGYVAIERVTGTLQGRSGSFVFQHSGSMDRGAQQLSITVVPDSGTGELAGISGTFRLNIVEGRHFYEFEYSLPNERRP